MLNGTGANAPQSSRMSPPVNAPLANETDTYLGAGDLLQNDSFRFEDGAQRSVTLAHTANLLATVDPAGQDSEGNTPLCLAAQAGNLARAQQLILRGADVHHINLDGDNALTLAAAGGHLTFIAWLDSHFRQSVDHENYYGETALTLAARHGHQPVVRWLVSQGASREHLNDRLKDALAEAVANGHLALAQWLSSQGSDLRRVYPDGNNLFLHAVCAGHQRVAQWLEDSGVDSQQVNESGDNALTLAARHGHCQLLAWLLEKNATDINQINRHGDSLLLMAVRQGHGQTAKLLVQHGADIGLVNYAGSNVLTLAAASSESLALWLCYQGTNIHQIDFSGNNAFTLAAESGFFQLLQTLEQLGINIHQVNHNNDNAFTLVARQGSLPWCQWLAGKGINIHQTNRQYHNAVTLAALAGSLPLLEWLCTAGVDWQQIPRASTKNSNHSETLYYGFNAAILAASAGHFTAAQWLIGLGLSIHQRDYYGHNAVIMAVQQGQLEAVQWFTAQGLVPDGYPDKFPEYYTDSHCNAMGQAAHLGHLHIMKWLHQHGGSLDGEDDEVLLVAAARRGDLPMSEWLCRQGVDPGCVDVYGANALSMAVRSGHLRLSQWLVSQGAEDVPDGENRDALKLAAFNGHNAIFRWLCPQSLDDRQANDLLLRVLSNGIGHRSLAVWLCLKVCRSIHGVNNDNYNALMLAASRGFLWLTQWLSEHTPDINQASRRGYTALILAAGNGHLPVVQWLYLERKADPYRKNILKADALQMAIVKGHTETANWLIGQGVVLKLNFFEQGASWSTVEWISNRNNVGLLRCLLRQQFPHKFLGVAMLDAANNGDIPALACCLSAGMSLQPNADYFHKSCFEEAAAGGSLATLEYLCDYSGGDYDVDKAKKSFLVAAAGRGNLHIIQWFWRRSGLSQDEANYCLIAASGKGHFHAVKWLCRQGADIEAKNDQGYSALAKAVRVGNLPMMEWFCQRGGDIYQILAEGRSALSLAIDYEQVHAALWLFQRGCRLIKSDIDNYYANREELILGMIFKMTSKAARATLFRASYLDQKRCILRGLELYGEDEYPSEEEADASFARFNQYNDKTLKHKCLLAVARIIERSGTLKARFDTVDNLPVSSDCKCDLRELVGINLA